MRHERDGDLRRMAKVRRVAGKLVKRGRVEKAGNRVRADRDERRSGRFNI